MPLALVPSTCSISYSSVFSSSIKSTFDLTNRIVDEKFEKSLSKLVTNFLLPAFIFCEIIKNLDVNNTSLMIQVVVGNTIIYGTGLIIGYLCSVVFKSPEQERNLLCGVMSALHTTSLPIILMDVLAPELNKIIYINADGTITDARNRGRLYIVLNSIFANIWRWGISYNLINPIEEDPEKLAKKDGLLDKEKAEKAKPKIDITFIDTIKEVLNVPIIVSILTIVLCYITPLRLWMISPDSIFLKTFISVNEITARSYNVMVILILGLNIANLLKTDPKGYKGDDISDYKLTVTTVMKLFVHPLIGTPILMYLLGTGFFEDGVLIFVYLFMLAAPNAINIIVVCSVKDAGERATSKMIMIQYVVAIATLTLGIAYFLYILI
jgi:predicted permease